MAELEKLLCTDSKVESLKKINAIIENGGGTGLQMFDTILKDHILTYEETKGLALQGTYVYKEAIAGSRYGYPDFYNKVVEEFNEATATETVNGVTVKVHSNGHKFYDIADKTAIDNYFNSIGIAWFYGVDTENERIFLPRSNYLTSYIANGDKTVRVYGDGKTLGLTNGSSNFALTSSSASPYQVQGFTNIFNTNVGTGATGNSLATKVGYGVVQNSSTSGLTGKVNIQNTQNGMYLYICVGNTTNYEGVTDVVDQGMEILEQVADKVNVDGTNLNAEGKSLFASLPMPSAKYIDLTVGATGTDYTAPANGWFCANVRLATSDGYVVLLNEANNMRSCSTIGRSQTSTTTGVYLPVKKGDTVKFIYMGEDTSSYAFKSLEFIYAEGEI